MERKNDYFLLNVSLTTCLFNILCEKCMYTLLLHTEFLGFSRGNICMLFSEPWAELATFFSWNTIFIKKITNKLWVFSLRIWQTIMNKASLPVQEKHLTVLITDDPNTAFMQKVNSGKLVPATVISERFSLGTGSFWWDCYWCLKEEVNFWCFVINGPPYESCT